MLAAERRLLDRSGNRKSRGGTSSCALEKSGLTIATDRVRREIATPKRSRQAILLGLPLNPAKTLLIAAAVVEFPRPDIRVTCHSLGDVDVAAPIQIVRGTNGPERMIALYRSDSFARPVDGSAEQWTFLVFRDPPPRYIHPDTGGSVATRAYRDAESAPSTVGTKPSGNTD
jgi:hypothetical protein